MIIFEPISTVLDEDGKKRLGIGQSTLSMWESGKVTPDLENLEKLADVWGKTPLEFVAYLYGRKLLSGSLFDAIDSMSANELAELQLLISRQMVAKINKVGKKSNSHVV